LDFFHPDIAWKLTELAMIRLLFSLHRRTNVVPIWRHAQMSNETMVDPVDYILVLRRDRDAVISYQEPTVEPYRNPAIARELPWIISFLGVNVQVGFRRITRVANPSQRLTNMHPFTRFHADSPLHEVSQIHG
jgi:hypothetical protein